MLNNTIQAPHRHILRYYLFFAAPRERVQVPFQGLRVESVPPWGRLGLGPLLKGRGFVLCWAVPMRQSVVAADFP